jgi:GNAT superfamily N-acetyltransferase
MDIRGIEERALNAWPALTTMLMDGWVLRLARGYTKRANSLNAVAPAGGIDAVLAQAEAIYRAAGQRPIVRLSPLMPDGADAMLAARGYEAADPTTVMTADIGHMAGDPEVEIAATLAEGWAAGFAAANNVPPRHRGTHDRMLAGLHLPTAFATLHQDGQPIAYGLAVAERGMIGLFDIVTLPAARRQGAGRRLVTSLLAWGRAHGAASAYLQVVDANAPAIALYLGLGFRPAYGYHYRLGTP